MKRLLLLALLFILALFSAWPRSHTKTVAEQEYKLQRELFIYQKQFGVPELWIDLQVKHNGTMHDPGAWGVTYFDESGLAHIEIMDQNDMPPIFQGKQRDEFQKHILQHEMLHVLMYTKGVPPEIQDGLIHIFQPYLKDK